jgi:hypothetical protein
MRSIAPKAPPGKKEHWGMQNHADLYRWRDASMLVLSSAQITKSPSLMEPNF